MSATGPCSSGPDSAPPDPAVVASLIQPKADTDPIEARFRTLADSIPNLAWSAGPDGKTTWCNRQWREYTGLPGDTTADWCSPTVHEPTTLLTVLERWNASLTTGQPFEMVFPLRGTDGQFRWFLTRVLPLRDTTGKIVQWFGTSTDINEQKQARLILTRSQDDLERLVADRTARLRDLVAELQHFSYTASHDLRAPLRGILTLTAVLQEDSAHRLSRTDRDCIERIATAAKALDRLIVDLLALTQVTRADLHLETINVQNLVQKILDQNPALQPPRADIELGHLDDVLGHELYLTQALSNLLTNAVKFVAPGVAPKVKLWSELNKDLVRIWIADNGIGIKPEHQPRLFRMFERLTSGYEGTGVGLAIVKRAVERIGGTVGVESDGTRGSSFWLDLRSAENPSSHK